MASRAATQVGLCAFHTAQRRRQQGHWQGQCGRVISSVIGGGGGVIVCGSAQGAGAGMCVCVCVWGGGAARRHGMCAGRGARQQPRAPRSVQARFHFHARVCERETVSVCV